MGILLTDEKLLSIDSVKTGIGFINTTISVGERNKIILIKSDCDINNAEVVISTNSIPVDGKLDEILEEDNSDDISLYSVLKKNAVLDNKSSMYVANSSGINFGLAPSNTNGQGVYIRSNTENSKYPIYYYRGNVSDNNVLFANFCWKIVRTTETGGIKLIYNGIPTNGMCNNVGDASVVGTTSFTSDITYNNAVGYMHGGTSGYQSTYDVVHSNKVDSVMKTYIDKWYAQKMISYSKYLEDEIWCNDRSLVSGSGIYDDETKYGASKRVGALAGDSPQPSLVCPNINDRFTVNSSNGNGALTYPVALLTADEVTLAGNGYTGYNSSSYLNNGDFWWLMSPNYYGMGDTSLYVPDPSTYVYMFVVSSEGQLYTEGYSAAKAGVRPAISLKNESKYFSGDGTADNPYKILED